MAKPVLDLIEKLLEENGALARELLKAQQEIDDLRRVIEVDLPLHADRRQSTRRKSKSRGGRNSAERRKQEADIIADYQQRIANHCWTDDHSLSVDDVVKEIQRVQKTKPSKVEHQGIVVRLSMSRTTIRKNIASLKPSKAR